MRKGGGQRIGVANRGEIDIDTDTPPDEDDDIGARQGKSRGRQSIEEGHCQVLKVVSQMHNKGHVKLKREFEACCNLVSL